MLVAIPTTVHEFYVGLGTAIMQRNFQDLGIAVPKSAQYAQVQHHVDAAKIWCGGNRQQLQVLARVARRAETSSDCMTSIMSDLGNDLYGVGTFLQTVQPSYIADIFVAGTQQERAEAVMFLKLLQLIAAQ